MSKWIDNGFAIVALLFIGAVMGFLAANAWNRPEPIHDPPTGIIIRLHPGGAVRWEQEIQK